MATDWPQEQLDAYNDIKEDGVAVTVRSNTYTSYDPKTDAETGAASVLYSTYTLVASFEDAINDNVMSLALLHDKTSVKKGDRMFTMPAYGLPDLANPGTLEKFDIVYDGNVHTVISVKSIEPGGLPILFKVQARR